MEIEVLLGFGGGALCGAIAGLLVALIQWWLKDLRDSRIRATPMEVSDELRETVHADEADPSDVFDPLAPPRPGRDDLHLPRMPSDRVFGRYHWPMALIGALTGGGLAATGTLPPLWSAASILLIPAALIPGLVVMAIYTFVYGIVR